MLGAGASKEANAPDVWELVDGFRTQANDSLLNDVITSLEENRNGAPGGKVVDIEMLLEALDVLSARDEQVLAAFVHRTGWAAKTSARPERFKQIRDHLYAYVRQELAIRGADTDYLQPIADLVSVFGGFDVFSLNYDTAIEMMCERAGLSWTDGFDPEWNESLLADTERFDIRLHKLHGSLLWYRVGDPDTRVVKVAVGPQRAADTPYFTGERLQEVLLYPAATGKGVYEEPHAALFQRFRQRLRDANVLIAIGCSFRDAHVRSIVLEQMTLNPSLRVVVIDPSVAEVLETSDDRLGPDWEFRRLRDRVLPLPERTGNILANHALQRYLQQLPAIGAAEGRVAVSRRRESSEQVAGHFAALVRESLDVGWGHSLSDCLRSAPGSVEYEAVDTLLSPLHGQSPTLLVARASLLAAADPDLRNRAAEALTEMMQWACATMVYEIDGKTFVAYPRDMHPIETAIDVTSHFDGRAAVVSQFVASLRALRERLAYHLPREATDAIDRAVADLEVAHEYFSQEAVASTWIWKARSTGRLENGVSSDAQTPHSEVMPPAAFADGFPSAVPRWQRPP